ncbi:hypothetical protein OIG29_07620 [Neisseria meningitidis]|nr:hypothetical protein [Neisseria meningitidis]MCV6718829.1 hypothetical protein [Neisseria meningitidis]MCV6720957.1 hypothetical protein [Neisseria meningitidis]MCV6724890.1 hypothetical protein [Neisseria meningitidis]MCV6727139.1 hypothetical protein [Neisseria meningitidis]MCV6729360.1 hypothetical protein [Neisseria meningitidis]
MPSGHSFRRYLYEFAVRFFKLETCRPSSGNRPDAAPFQAVII